MKKYAFFILISILSLACKPTEKNYQKAYDKAAEAAERKNRMDTESVSGGKLDSFNAPRVQIVEGDTVWVSSVRVKPFETTIEGADKAVVAIAHYKMPTNARRHAEDIRKDYPDAFVAKDGDENYYVVIGRASGYKDAAPLIRQFKETHPGYRYIGMNDGPIVLFIL